MDLIADNTITALHDNSLDLNTLQPDIHLNEDISAPIAIGDKIGTATYTVDNTEYTVNLLANSNVEKDISFYIIICIVGILLLLISLHIMKKVKEKNTRKK